MTLRRLLLLIMVLAMSCAEGTAWAQSATVGQVTHLSGVLSARHADGTRTLLGLKSAVLAGDVLITEKETYARVKFLDAGEVVLRPASEVVVEKYAYDIKAPENDAVVIRLVKGGLRAVTGLIGKRSKESVQFSAPTATIGIRGTHFGAVFCQNDCAGVKSPSGEAPGNGLHLDVASGAIVVTNDGGVAVFSAGQFGYVANVDRTPVLVPASQGIEVTMPQTISSNTGSGTQKIGAAKLDACISQ